MKSIISSFLNKLIESGMVLRLAMYCSCKFFSDVINPIWAGNVAILQKFKVRTSRNFSFAMVVGISEIKVAPKLSDVML